MIAIDMKMPKNCVECRFGQRECGFCHAATANFVGYVYQSEDEGRPDWCPLVEVGSPKEMQGRWERVGFDIVRCSECGMPMKKTHICFPDGESGYYYIATKYCPHCGAKNEKGDCDA